MDSSKKDNFNLLDYSIFDREKDDAEIDDFVKAKKTKEFSKYSWNVFKRFLEKKEIRVYEKNIEPAVLDQILCTFFMKATKKEVHLSLTLSAVFIGELQDTSKLTL